MARRKKIEMEVEERRTKVTDMYLKGWRQSDIARELGVHRSQITRDLEACRKEWRESRVTDIEAHQIVELEKLDRVEREAWAAWERSQKDAEKHVTEDGDDKSKTRHEVTGQYGDGKFLAEVRSCIEQRCKILGLNAPEKQEHTGKDGDPLAMEVVINSREEMLEFKSIRERLIGVNGNGHGSN